MPEKLSTGKKLIPAALWTLKARQASLSLKDSDDFRRRRRQSHAGVQCAGCIVPADRKNESSKRKAFHIMYQSAGDVERETIERELTPGFTIREAQGTVTPFVFSSPHSGRTYPSAFLAASRLSPQAIRKSEDSFVDDIFANVTQLGAPLIATRFPRAYLDVNREPFELDPILFSDPVPDYANTRSVRVMSGLGTVARVVADGEAIYKEPLPLAVAFERITRLYRPFHTTLRRYLEERRRVCGHAILVDCHSMPSNQSGTTRSERPDIILGDRFGLSCRPELTHEFHGALQAEGFTVVQNRPYAGGYITEHYGSPNDRIEAIQIEINRGLYMDEQRFLPRPEFGDVRRGLERALASVMSRYGGAVDMVEAAE